MYTKWSSCSASSLAIQGYEGRWFGRGEGGWSFTSTAPLVFGDWWREEDFKPGSVYEYIYICILVVAKTLGTQWVNQNPFLLLWREIELSGRAHVIGIKPSPLTLKQMVTNALEPEDTPFEKEKQLRFHALLRGLRCFPLVLRSVDSEKAMVHNDCCMYITQR